MSRQYDTTEPLGQEEDPRAEFAAMLGADPEYAEWCARVDEAWAASVEGGEPSFPASYPAPYLDGDDTVYFPAEPDFETETRDDPTEDAEFTAEDRADFARWLSARIAEERAAA